jgi:two-component system chemotaxis response regulator CheB
VRLVAVGCSWGGLAALTTLLGALPSDLDAAVVVVQHRGPDESQLGQLLHERSALPVREVDDKDEILPRQVFLGPPGYHLLIEPGTFALSTDAPVHHARPSLDVLFESAADAYGRDCIGVVLTGASADGAAGLARIAAAGGAALVQDPGTSERHEMPAAALAAAARAISLPLDGIAPAIADLCASGATAFDRAAHHGATRLRA